jgi:hypothetical protein
VMNIWDARVHCAVLKLRTNPPAPWHAYPHPRRDARRFAPTGDPLPTETPEPGPPHDHGRKGRSRGRLPQDPTVCSTNPPPPVPVFQPHHPPKGGVANDTGRTGRRTRRQEALRSMFHPRATTRCTVGT